MTRFGCRKNDNLVEPGPNPFRPPMVLNTHMKYDERVQTLDVLVRNLENTPRGEKVKVVGTFVERNASNKRKKPGFFGRVMHREKTDAQGYTINTHSTSAKPGPNPHYNKNFPFDNLIRSDVQYGKLLFEIYESGLVRKKLLGCVEMDGSDIKIDRDTAYSLYIRDPNYNSQMCMIQSQPCDVPDGVCRTGTMSSTSSSCSGKPMVCYSANNVVCEQGRNGEVHASREYECFQERDACSSTTPSSSRNCSSDGSGTIIYEVVTRDGRTRGYSTCSNSTTTSCSSSSSSSTCSDESEITVYEIVNVDACKVPSQRECRQQRPDACFVKDDCCEYRPQRTEACATKNDCCEYRPQRTDACVTKNDCCPVRQDDCCGVPKNDCCVITQNQGRCFGVPDEYIDENAMILHSNIQYNDRRQRLTVFIRNLRCVDDDVPHTVKCVLYTADGRRLERRTSKKYGMNPYFNQDLKFTKLVPSDIRGGHLLFTVNERKRCHKDVVGMGIIPGSSINLNRDESYNTAIVQQYCSKIASNFVYNPKDMTTEPDNLLRVVYPECQKHFEVYK